MTRARFIFALLLACTAIAADKDKKSLPNQAGNTRLSLDATVITDRKAITDLLGVDLGENYIVVKMHATPQTLEPLRLSIDDFTLISRKNGEKSGAFAPTAIAGAAGLIITQTAPKPGSIGTNPMGMPIPMGGPNTRTPRPSPGIGNTGSVESAEAEARTVRNRTVDPRLAALEAKVFPDGESKAPVDGLLYFNLETKSKPENLGLIYAGPAGRLVIDFK